MADFTNILALDTAMGGCTACAAAGDRVVSRSEQMPRGQAEHLVPFAQEVMQGVELAYEQLDAILCTIGPGAFTGLRIGMSAARAFGLSHDTPVYGITTMHALALKYADAGEFSVILETKRSDFYVQHFNDGEPVSEPVAQEYGDVVASLEQGTTLIGDGVGCFLNMGEGGFAHKEGYVLPDMEVVTRAFVQSDGQHPFFIKDPQPVYLRGADVSQSKKKQRILANEV